MTNTMSSNEQNPSLVGGHAQYVKGAAEGAVGSVTGADDWKSSADQDKQAGIDAMKQASANRDPNQSGFGKAEELAGKAAGCEGMEKEGAESKQA
ncbi:hypothetical protein D0867_01257 [Hortaea werneckii]|uniref:CsbD-like domain-containing protein n=3 Tax=Hortaea werneckii TaxID=91943 RepID=A0A3M7AB33_HORWE|nr:hypothetical protein D0867_01257 [Hortaea werneckii]